MHPPLDHNLDEALDRAAALLGSARKVAALTGAGVSAESGLATFRGAGGLWEGQRVEDVATPRAFARDPALVWRFYNLRRGNLATVAPNPGHHALVALERQFGPDNFTLITQNVDGLHIAAGSQNVLEIHGALRRVRCTGCGVAQDRGVEALPELPRCRDCEALLRPDVVWFEEMLPPDVWDRAEQAAASCDCFLVIGTSALVYPAAGLTSLARSNGAETIEVNLTRTPASSAADVVLLGPSGTILPQLLARRTAALTV
jgi:NAD-dependent deacetylase